MPESILAASFNVQALSIKKVRNPEVSALIARIILRYDVCLVMEVRDASGLVVEGILQLLAQAVLADSTPPVEGIVSTREITQSSLESISQGKAANPSGFKAIRNIFKKLEKKFSPGVSESRTSLTSQGSIRRRRHRQQHQLSRSVSQARLQVNGMSQKPLPSRSLSKRKSKARARATARSRAVRDDDSYVDEGEDDGEDEGEDEGGKEEEKEGSGSEHAPSIQGKEVEETSRTKKKTKAKRKATPRTKKQEDDTPLIPEADLPYLAVASEPLGKGTHKERYVWFYRRTVLRPLASKVYGSEDIYARPPFAVKFEFTRNPESTITLAGLHTQPTKSVEELTALHGINDRITHEQSCTRDDGKGPLQRQQSAPSIKPASEVSITHTGGKRRDESSKTSVSGLTKLLKALSLCIPCIPRPPKPHPPVETQPPPPPPPPPKTSVHLGPVLMGDFNAGKNYVPMKARKNMELFTDPKYVWGIPDHADTTVRGSTNNAYDRIIWPKYQGAYFGDADVWMFEKEWSLSEEQALKVSDHYPVAVEIHIP